MPWRSWFVRDVWRVGAITTSASSTGRPYQSTPSTTSWAGWSSRTELARYARAVAEVGLLASLLAEIRQRGTRREHLMAQLQTVAGAAKLAALDPAHVRQDLRERLTDWQGLLRWGRRRRGRSFARCSSGQATLSGLLAGVVSSDVMVTPAGFEPLGVLQVHGIMRVA